LNINQNIDVPFLHFSFLKDIKVYGVYNNSFVKYLETYPYVRNEHFHNFYTILLVTGGQGKITVNDTTYAIKPKTICLIAPDQRHSYKGVNNAEGKILFICQDYYVEEFSYIRLLNVFSCTSQVTLDTCKPCILLSDTEYKTLFDLFGSINKEYDSYTPANNAVTIIRSFINIMLLRLTDIHEMKSDNLNTGSTIIINDLSHLIDSSFLKEHNIKFYAAALNISEKQLNDLCNRFFNRSLKKILKDRLMLEARKLLISSEMSISEISYKLNYDDNSYFNKVFRNEIGLTPKKFRDIHRKLIP